jgi:hypothetical protein
MPLNNFLTVDIVIDELISTSLIDSGFSLTLIPEMIIVISLDLIFSPGFT